MRDIFTATNWDHERQESVLSTIKMIARNIGRSSKSVERHIKELAGKKSPVTTTYKKPPLQPVGKWGSMIHFPSK